MEVEFYKDKAGEDRWHVIISDEGSGKRDVHHACHEGFSSNENALNNLFINYSLLSIAIRQLAQGVDKIADLYFVTSSSGNGVRWKLKAANGELVGQAHKDFDNILDALNNMMITHTILTVFVRELAYERSVSGMASSFNDEDDEGAGDVG